MTRIQMTEEEIAYQSEIRRRDPVGICESCGAPIWDRANLVQWEDDVQTHAGHCSDGNGQTLSQIWLREELAYELELLVLTGGKIGTARLNQLMGNLNYYRFGSDATYLVWGATQDHAREALRAYEKRHFRGGIDEFQSVDEMPVVKLTPKQITNHTFHNEGRPGTMLMPVVRSAPTSCAEFIGCSEW